MLGNQFSLYILLINVSTMENRRPIPLPICSTTMITKFHNERSAAGLRLDELKSALQKYVRRGEEAKALRVAEELDRFAEVEDGSGERIRSNFIHRIQVIYLEDVGLGNVALWPRMTNWISDLDKERKRGDMRDRQKEIRTVKRIVMHMCRSKKVRIGSYLGSLAFMRAGAAAAQKKVAGRRYEGNLASSEELRGSLSDLRERFKQTMEGEVIPRTEALGSALLKLIVKRGGLGAKERKETFRSLATTLPYIGCAEAWARDIGHLREAYQLVFQPLAAKLYGAPVEQYWSDSALEIDGEGGGVWAGGEMFKLDEYVYDKHVRGGINAKIPGYFVQISSLVVPELTTMPIDLKWVYGGWRGVQQSRKAKELEREWRKEMATRPGWSKRLKIVQSI